MTAIWEFELQHSGARAILMPSGATVLSVQNQNEKLVLWALVNTDNQAVLRRFDVVLTGGRCDRHPDEFIGTVQFADGAYVAHVFEF